MVKQCNVKMNKFTIIPCQTSTAVDTRTSSGARFIPASPVNQLFGKEQYTQSCLSSEGIVPDGTDHTISSLY